MNFEFEHQGYLVTANVTETYDGYGTGDSPTLYEVNIRKVLDLDGDNVKQSELGDGFIDELEDEAIRVYKG
jgi:hypothetical protein